MSIYGNKLYKPYMPLFPTPTDIPLQSTCVTISIPQNPAFIGLWIGVLLFLCDPENFVQFEDGISRETTAEIFHDALLNALTLEEISCPYIVPAPYWDEETTADDEAESDVQTWYGVIEDFLAPIDDLDFIENAAVWGITGFVAYAAGPGAAIFFRTVARRFVLAVQVDDVGEIIRVVVDAVNYNIDTTGHSAGDIIELEIPVTDDELATHDIYVINTGVP